MNFSQNLAMVMVQSADQFPVDFDNAWKWIGWTRKSKAKKTLTNNFVEGVDFCARGCKSSTGGRSSELILLTVDCFKSLGMMAGTEKGKEIRQYFLKCEKQVKEIIPAQNAELEKLRFRGSFYRNLVNDSQLPLKHWRVSALGSQHWPLVSLRQIIEKERPTTVVQDAYGRSVTYDGATITELSKRYGFGNGTKARNQCREWIRSMGIDDGQWVEEPAARITYKLPKAMLPVLDQCFSQGRGQRQKLLGETN